MAELAKINKRKNDIFKAGTRVSVPRHFFDTTNDKVSQNLPGDVSKWYGSITSVVNEESGRVDVLWEMDNTTTTTYTSKLSVEPSPQLSTPCCTSSDGQAVQLLNNGTVIFEGKVQEGAEVVHGYQLKGSEQKYLITKVVNSHLYEKFDEDRHCVGSYIAWDKQNTSQNNKEIRQWLKKIQPKVKHASKLVTGSSGRIIRRNRKEIDYSDKLDSDDDSSADDDDESQVYL